MNIFKPYPTLFASSKVLYVIPYSFVIIFESRDENIWLNFSFHLYNFFSIFNINAEFASVENFFFVYQSIKYRIYLSKHKYRVHTKPADSHPLVKWVWLAEKTCTGILNFQHFYDLQKIFSAFLCKSAEKYQQGCLFVGFRTFSNY